MSDQHLREQLANALAHRQAHQLFDTAIESFPPDHYNTRPPNVPYSFWHLLEHLRIAQADILDYIENPNYQYLNFPDDYWPPPDEEADSVKWQSTSAAFRTDLAALVRIVKDPARDLFRRGYRMGNRVTPSCARFWSSPRIILITLGNLASCARPWICGKSGSMEFPQLSSAFTSIKRALYSNDT